MALNPEQRAVVEAGIERSLNVVAGAGTGKTRVLVERYLRFLRDGVPPARLLALTFTLKAADEMRQRIYRVVEAEHPERLRDFHNAWLMNFHSFGYRLIRENAPALAIDLGATVATEADLRRIDRALEARFLAGKIDGVPADFGFGGAVPSPTKLSSLFGIYLGVVKKCRGDMIPIDALLEACRDEDAEPYVENVRAIGAVYDAYAVEIKRRNLIDFSDMITLAVRMLKERPDLRRAYERKFDHILVDEFQDTSSAQYALLDLLSGGTFERVTVVGDGKQSIYRWRDARVENIRDFPGDKSPLATNYRSRQNILDLAHAFIQQDAEAQAGAVKLVADRGEPGKPIVIFHPEDDEAHTQQNDAEAAALSAWIAHLTGGPEIPGVPALVGGAEPPLRYGDIAVLLRGVREYRVLPAIERAFQRSGIPYVVVGGADASGSRALEQLYAFLSLFLPGDRQRELLQMLESPPFAIGGAALMELFGRDSAAAATADALLSDERVARVTTEEARHCLETFRDIKKSLDRTRSARGFRAFLAEVLEETPFFMKLFHDGASLRAAEDLERDLWGMCDDLEARRELGLWAFVEHLRAALDERSFGKDESLAIPPGRVRLMTIHQAKGLEFPAVAVVGIKQPPPEREGFFVSRKSGVYSERWKDWDRGYDAAAEREEEKRMRRGEERRLVYVAMTRAKDYLFVSSPYAGGKEKRGGSLFTDVLECLRHGDFNAAVIRSVTEVGQVTAVTGRAERAGGPRETEVSGAAFDVSGDVSGDASGDVSGVASDDTMAGFAAWRDAHDQYVREEQVPAVPDNPVRFVNWSALGDFADCPLRYRYRYLLRMGDAAFGGESAAEGLANEKGEAPEKSYVPQDFTPAQYGIVVHELLRDAVVAAIEGKPLQEGWIERAVRDRGLPAALARKVEKSGGRILTRFLKSPLATAGPKVRLEERFLVRMNRALFHGIFDRIERTDGGWRVLDYKVGLARESVRNSTRDTARETARDVARAKHLFQVSFYMWALGRITGEERISGEICYLREDALDVRPVDPSGMKIGEHAGALDCALASGSFPPTPGEACRGCAYALICPAAPE